MWLTESARAAAFIAAFVAALTLIAKSPLGRGFAWVYRRLFGEPLTDKLTQAITKIVTPQLTRVEEKNDAQHLENRQAIDRLTEELFDHRVETRDRLFEIGRSANKNHELLVTHFEEAKNRDRRIDALELKGVGHVDIHMAPESTVDQHTPPEEP